MNGLWLTWETQRRNKELSAAFGFHYGHLDHSSLGRLSRYFKSGLETLQQLKTRRPEVVIAQCPSIVLCILLVLVQAWRSFVFVVDAHNVTVEQLSSSNAFLRLLVRFLLRRADLVIVSNSALVSLLETNGITAAMLPDKLPSISVGKLPARFESYKSPRFVLIASYASDEPIEEFITAFIKSGNDASLFITGRRKNAATLLRFESEQIIFTDFLSLEDYEALIANANLLIDLTTREDCLVCGAYEAISVGVPILLSDTSANREVFPIGTLYAKNTGREYQNALKEFALRDTELQAGILKMQEEFLPYWERSFSELKLRLEQASQA